jgi:hypothetical protein
VSNLATTHPFLVYLKATHDPRFDELDKKLQAWHLANPDFLGRLRAWFHNFGTEQDQVLALRLLLAMDYHHEAHLEDSFKLHLDALKRQEIYLSGDKKNALVVLPCNPVDSAYRHGWLISKIEGLPGKSFHSLDKLTPELIGDNHLVFINDTHGAGNQFMREIWGKLEAQGVSPGKVVVLGIAIAQQAHDEFAKAGFVVTPKEIAKSAYTEFSYADFERLRAMGEKLSPGSPLGYGDTALLVAYHFQCPNNTLLEYREKTYPASNKPTPLNPPADNPAQASPKIPGDSDPVVESGPPPQRTLVYISYRQIDDIWRRRLREILDVDPRLQGLVWDDTDIFGGDPWEAAMRDHVARARIMVMLASEDYFGPESGALEPEIKPALTAHARGELDILWFPVRPLSIKASPVAHIMAATGAGAVPLEQLSPEAQATALNKVYRAILGHLGLGPLDSVPARPSSGKATTANKTDLQNKSATMSANESGSSITWLHLSDLHIEDSTAAKVYRTQLETDLLNELKVARLDYIVISGDIGDYALETEYAAAFDLVHGLMQRFGVPPERLMVVPGNHDLNWGKSREAYCRVVSNPPNPLPPEYLNGGDAGAVARDEDNYRQRFAVFNEHFYRPLLGVDYPLEYESQITWVEQPEHRLLFVGFNSAWQIDHYYKQRAAIHRLALAGAFDRLHDGDYDGWLKIAVWHHPVMGAEAMNGAFLEQLATNGFQVCLHGHIHEAQNNLFRYDHRGIEIIGAGTFGAPAKDQVPGIPLQYNLLRFDPHNATLTVHTRKKEKPDGAWSADARWGDKNAPKPWYEIKVAGYEPPGRTDATRDFRDFRGQDRDYQAQLLAEIESLLAAHPALDAALQIKAGKRLPAGRDWVQWFSRDPIKAVDDELRPAVEQCLRANDSASRAYADLWQAARRLLDKLILFAVDPEAIVHLENHRPSQAWTLEIAVSSGLSVEIVSARFRQMPTCLVVEDGRPDIRSPNAIELPPPAITGWDEDYQVERLCLEIWQRIFPRESRQTLSPNDYEELRETLLSYEKHKEAHYYISAPERLPSPLKRSEFYAKLFKKLPIVVVFMRSESGQRGLVVQNETRFKTAVRQFLLYLEKHPPRAP